MEIRALDPSDRSPEADAAWNARVDLAHALDAELWGAESTRQDPEGFRTNLLARTTPCLLLVAMEGDSLVGSCTLNVKNEDTPVRSWFYGGVRADHRRRGIGGALLDAAIAAAREHGCADIQVGTVIRVGVDWPDLTPEVADDAAAHLLRSRGFRRYQTFVISRATLDRAALPQATEDHRTRLAAGGVYAVEVAEGVVPSDWFAPLAPLLAAMATDAPSGELAVRPETWDAERVARRFDPEAHVGHRLVLAVARHLPTGEFAGYTEMSHRDGQAAVFQGDTLVRREHRGHGLGVALKTTALEAAATAFPGARYSETGNALENAPMLAANRALGYRPHAIAPQWSLTL